MFDLLKKLFSIMPKDQKKRIYFLIFLSTFAALSEVFSIVAAVPFIAAITNPEALFKFELLQPLIIFLNITDPKDLITPISIMFCSGALIAGILRIVLLRVSIIVSNQMGVVLSKQIYASVLYQPYISHVSQSSSEIMSALTQKVGLVVNIITSIINTLISSILFTSIIIGLMFINSIIASSAILCFGTIYIIISVYSKKQLHSNSIIISKIQTSTIRCLQEGLGSIRDIIIGDNYKIYIEEYKDNLVKLFNANGENKFISQSPRFIMESLGLIILSVLALIFLNKNSYSIDYLPVLGALALAAQKCIPMLQTFYGSYSDIKANTRILEDVLSLLSKKIEESHIEVQKNIDFKKIISFQNISFWFNHKKNKILNEVSFEINSGDIIGVIGKTGSGKSTLLDIIMCVLSPNEGKIIVDDVILDNSNKKSFQNLINHVPQSIFLKEGTIAENIAFGIPVEKINMNDVKKAAKVSQLNDFLNQVEEGLLTEVGERGVKLSGGQRQRIGIARALYKKSSILIFDEATNALDHETELNVIDGIHKSYSNKTMIFVTHEKSSLKFCNKIIKIEKNKIINIKV